MKKAFAPYFPFYPERWLAGVVSMSDADQIAYLRLLLHAWLLDGLPVDDAALKRLAGRKVSAAVLAKFPVADDGKRRNPFLERVRAKQIKGLDARRKNGAKGNAKRWLGISLADGDSDGNSDATAVAKSSPPLPLTPENTHTQAAGPGGVAFPSWFPATEEKAVAMCAAVAVPAEYVRSVWNQLVGREFKDGAGREVTRFAHHVAGRWPKERASWEADAPRGGGKQPPTQRPRPEAQL